MNPLKGRSRLLFRPALLLFLLAPGPSFSGECSFAPSTGQVRVMVILINFSDTSPAYSPAEIEGLFFGSTESTVRDYYLEQSYGSLELFGEVYGWYTASQTHDYYGNGNRGFGGPYSYPGNLHRLAEEAVDLAEAGGADFSLYDNTGDGCVDALVILHQGQGQERSGDSTRNNIWSTMSALSGGGAFARNYDGVLIDRFAMVPEISFYGDRMEECGVIAHEYGHMMGLIDMYDKDNSSAGVGLFDLMGIGNWGGDYWSPELPVHLSAYNKMLLGWLDPVVVRGATQGAFVLPFSEGTPFALNLPADPGVPGEFFLVENRKRTGYDRNLMSEGVAIYHVDERGIFENRHELVGCGYQAPRISVEQADGLFELENKQSWGDTTDFFPAQGAAREFHAATVPSSKNHGCRLSRVSVTGIGDPGDTVSLFARTDDKRPEAPYPLLFVESVSWNEVSGDMDGRLEAGEVFAPVFTLANNGATATGVSATVSAQGPFLNAGDTVLSFPEVGIGATASHPEKVYFSVSGGYRRGQEAGWLITVTFSGGTAELSGSAALGEPDTLFVDDDGGGYVERNMIPALSEQGFFHDTWTVKEQGPPASSELSHYDRVLWATGADGDSALTPAEMAALSGYLDQGGNLVLSSQLLLFEPRPGVTTFARDYLHVVDSWDDRWAVYGPSGMDGDPISHTYVLFTETARYFYFPRLNRTCGLLAGASAAGFVTNDRGNLTAVRFPADPPGPYTSVFLSYGIEAYLPEHLPNILRRLLNYRNYRAGLPFATQLVPDGERPKAVDLTVAVWGLDFTSDTRFSFPEGDMEVTYASLAGTGRVNLTLNIDIDARIGWHDLLLTSASGDTVRVENMFEVYGEPYPNKVPVAAAGPDLVGLRSDFFTLDGSNSYDPDYDPLTFKWTQLSGATVSLSPSDTVPVTGFNPASGYIGDYLFELTVSDPYDSKGDTARVTVSNQAPVADAGPDGSGYRTDSFQLDGSGSGDPDGDALHFSWSQLSGATVSLQPSSTAAAVSFTPAWDYEGDYLFALWVGDGWDSEGDTVRVVVSNRPPEVRVVSEVMVIAGDTVVLDGSSSFDLDGDALDYHWSQESGPEAVTLDAADPARPVFSTFTTGIYTFSLFVSDPFEASGSSLVTVYMASDNNDPPVAEAGDDLAGYRSQAFTLDGSSSYDLNGDSLAFSWTLLFGATVSLVPSSTAESVQFSPVQDYVGDYLFMLTVSDPHYSDSDTVRVTVMNRLPVAYTGPEQTGVTGQVLTLDGSNSYDLDNDPLTYLWVQFQGPAVTLDLADPSMPAFTPSDPGNYMFGLRVSDPFGTSLNMDTTGLIVTSPGNNIPVTEAGTDRTVDWWDPGPVQLDGSSSRDPDGDTLYYQWTILASPPGSAAQLSDPYDVAPEFHDDVPGDYLFSLKAGDHEVWGYEDYVMITSSDQFDNDNDGIPDYYDPDDDNDMMPDLWESLEGLDPMDAGDGAMQRSSATDPDGDGKVNLHEFFDSRDPQAADSYTCDRALAGCFFAEATGDFSPTATDANFILALIIGAYSPVAKMYPRNGDNLDVTGDGSVTATDAASYRSRITDIDYAFPGPPAQMTLVSPGYSVSAQPGDTVRITVRVTDSSLSNNGVENPRSGEAVIFEPIRGDLLLLGGEADIPRGRNLEEASELNSHSANESTFHVSGDELEAVVASDRAGGRGGFDLYLAKRNHREEAFSALQPLDSVNTDRNDFSPSLTGDGLTMFFARNTADAGWNLFYAVRPDRDSPFQPPLPLAELNSGGYESSPSVTPDGLTLYYVRYVAGKSYDIFVATRPEASSPFGPPQAVDQVNSSYYDNAPSINADSTRLYFFSNRPAANSGYNIWYAERPSEGEPFGVPVELSLVNTDQGEFKAWESADGKRLYFSTFGYSETGAVNIFMLKRPSADLPFWYGGNSSRYDITGQMNEGAALDSGGRASMVVSPLSCGLIELAVWCEEDPYRFYPSFSLPEFIRINVPCP